MTIPLTSRHLCGRVRAIKAIEFWEGYLGATVPNRARIGMTMVGAHDDRRDNVDDDLRRAGR